MDNLSYALSKKFTNQEIEKVNQTIVNVTNQVTSGIKSIEPNENQWIFTFNDNSTIAMTIDGLSQENFTTIEKNKLALLNSDILSKFTYVDSNLLFNGNLVENNKLDLSNYYTQTQINNLLNNKANAIHNHNVSEILNLQTELSNRYTKLETLSKTEIQDLVNSVAKGMNWKDSVLTLLELPLTGNAKTDTRIVVETSHMYVWNGTSWVDLGGSDNLPLASSILDGKMSKEDKSKLDSIILENLVSITQLNNALDLKADKNEIIDLTAIEGDIIPITNSTQNIGSPTNRFKTIYVDEAMLSVNTLYLGDTPVMGTNQDTIVIKGDIDQSITMKTTGTGTTKVISESGVELSTSGMNANINVQATGSGANANLSATNQVNLNAPNVSVQSTSTDIKGATSVDNLTIRGNLTINGATTTIESTTVKVEDNIIELNKNEVGYGVTAGKAGIKINRGDADAQLIVFDETDDMFKVGTDSLLKTIATEDYVNTQNSNKVDKIVGKGLSTEDYTTTEKNKLSGISSNATKVEQSTTNGNVLIDGVETTVYTVNDEMLNLTPITTIQRNELTGLNACSVVFDSDIGALMCYDGSTWYQL